MIGNKGNSSSSASLSIPDSKYFDTETARDDYYIANPTQLKNKEQCAVKSPDDYYIINEYDGSVWVEKINIARGPAGKDGDGTLTKTGIESVLTGEVTSHSHPEKEWTDIQNKPDYLNRISTSNVFWLKGDGLTVGDIKAVVESGNIRYLELGGLPNTWVPATIEDINLSTHGSLNARLEALENAREFAGGLDATGSLAQLSDAINGQYWLCEKAGTLSGVSLAINDMIICHTDVVGTPANLDNFAHIVSTFSDMQGASSSTDGTSGLVPRPIAGDEDKVLKGDGTWSEQDINFMTGATSVADGSKGVPPIPIAGDENKVLTGGGTWEDSGVSALDQRVTDIEDSLEDTCPIKVGEHIMYALENPIRYKRADVASDTTPQDVSSWGLKEGSNYNILASNLIDYTLPNGNGTEKYKVTFKPFLTDCIIDNGNDDNGAVVWTINSLTTTNTYAGGCCGKYFYSKRDMPNVGSSIIPAGDSFKVQKRFLGDATDTAEVTLRASSSYNYGLSTTLIIERIS